MCIWTYTAIQNILQCTIYNAYYMHMLQCSIIHVIWTYTAIQQYILQYRTYYNVLYTMHTTCTCYSTVLYMSYGHILQYSNTYYNTEHTTMYYIQCILHAHAVQYYTCHMRATIHQYILRTCTAYKDKIIICLLNLMPISIMQ